MRTFSNTRLAATAASAALLAGVGAVTVYDQIPLALATTGTAVSERVLILFNYPIFSSLSSFLCCPPSPYTYMTHLPYHPSHYHIIYLHWQLP
jgi:hypothetical protein